MLATEKIKETETQRFERILARAEFKPLKAVFDNLDADAIAKGVAINTTNSYQLFLGKLGLRVVVVKQIHEQDCYARLGPAGGIRAVLPIHDTATYSTMVTLVNYDSPSNHPTNTSAHDVDDGRSSSGCSHGRPQSSGRCGYSGPPVRAAFPGDFTNHPLPADIAAEVQLLESDRLRERALMMRVARFSSGRSRFPRSSMGLTSKCWVNLLKMIIENANSPRSIRPIVFQ